MLDSGGQSGIGRICDLPASQLPDWDDMAVLSLRCVGAMSSSCPRFTRSAAATAAAAAAAAGGAEWEWVASSLVGWRRSASGRQLTSVMTADSRARTLTDTVQVQVQVQV